MYKFNIIITELCNANCSHCYMSKESNKLKKTMSKEQIKKIVDNIPLNTDTLVLTGGEIFLVKDLLFYTIGIIKEKNSNIQIGLESNGKYFYTNNDPYRELVLLKRHGVDFIRFSDDIFHQDGGIDLSKVLELKKYEKYDTPRIKFLKQNTAIPIGNAKKLPSQYKARSNCMNNLNTVQNPYIFVDVEGNANLCTWKCIPPIGNMIKENFSIIEERLNNKFYKYILMGKIEKAIAYKTGQDVNKLDNESYEKGQCYLCIKYFRGA